MKFTKKKKIYRREYLKFMYILENIVSSILKKKDASVNYDE
jgi:hypothetical protein